MTRAVEKDLVSHGVSEDLEQWHWAMQGDSTLSHAVRKAAQDTVSLWHPGAVDGWGKGSRRLGSRQNRFPQHAHLRLWTPGTLNTATGHML